MSCQHNNIMHLNNPAEWKCSECGLQFMPDKESIDILIKVRNDVKLVLGKFQQYIEGKFFKRDEGINGDHAATELMDIFNRYSDSKIPHDVSTL